MRITVLATSRHALRQPWTGGQEAHTARLVQGLRSRGHHVVLHARAGTEPGLADELVPYLELPPLSAVSALDPQLPEPGFLEDHAAFLSAMTDVLRRGDADVVHNQSLHHLPLSMSGALDVPLVTTLHTPPFPWMEVGIALADERARYVGVSAANAALWTSLPTPATVIPNGVPTGPEAVGPGGDDLVWVGRITPEKGLADAIAAARQAGRRLRVVGPVSDPEHFEQVVRPVLGHGVEHLGHLDEDDSRSVVETSAACLVTPRWEEPFGLVAAEAMVRGTPVVAVDRGGLREVVGAKGGVLVPPEPGDGLAGRLAEGVGAAARLDRREVAAWARATHSLDRMVDRYESLFADVVAGPR